MSLLDFSSTKFVVISYQVSQKIHPHFIGMLKCYTWKFHWRRFINFWRFMELAYGCVGLCVLDNILTWCYPFMSNCQIKFTAKCSTHTINTAAVAVHYQMFLCLQLYQLLTPVQSVWTSAHIRIRSECGYSHTSNQ